MKVCQIKRRGPVFLDSVYFNQSITVHQGSWHVEIKWQFLLLKIIDIWRDLLELFEMLQASVFLNAMFNIPNTSFLFHFLDATFDGADTTQNHDENDAVELQHPNVSFTRPLSVFPAILLGLPRKKLLQNYWRPNVYKSNYTDFKYVL